MVGFDFKGHSFRVVAMLNQFFVQWNNDKQQYEGAEIKKFSFLEQKLNFNMR